MHRKSLVIAAAITAALPAAASAATETITYTYDARGRLVKVVHSGSGTANEGVETTTTHDKAGNRETQTTTGA